jgi:arginyl-tRNA synthetase
MIRHDIERMLEQALQEAHARGLLPATGFAEVAVEHPQNAERGDFASSLPLKIARSARMDPLAVAKAIVGLLPASGAIENVEIAPPGFINFKLKPTWLAAQVDAILQAGECWGDTDVGKGAKVQVEFVSVNPTGPLHVGHGRGAVLGSTLASILQAAGYDTEREYYLNDAGAQIMAFGRSLYARYAQALGVDEPMPPAPNAYTGDYMIDLAKQIADEHGDGYLSLPREQALDALAHVGIARMVESIKADLALLRVQFDQWYSERSLYEESQYERAMKLLQEGKHVVRKEGATWFVSSALGEDKDNVLVRSDGTPTYFASDIAYHFNKFVERGFEQVINIWGADHAGHVSRMKAAVGALGINPNRLKVIITQMVSLRRGTELVKASKRTGDIVTLRDVIDEVGADACRFNFLSRSADSQMDFDLELAKRQSADNPVYYVQYAHARIASILRNAAARGIDHSQGDVSLLTGEPELALIRKMLLLTELVELGAQNLEPHHLPHYAQDVATVFHGFYDRLRVISDDEALTGARLKLVQAAQITLARTLQLMGMTAPERM